MIAMILGVMATRMMTAFLFTVWQWRNIYGCSLGSTVAQAIDVGLGRAPSSTTGIDNKSNKFFLAAPEDRSNTWVLYILNTRP